MGAFRILLLIMIVVLFTYTGVVGTNQGWDLLPVFFGDIFRMTWPGQFNVDFSCLLIFYGFWLAWRHHFSPTGFSLGFPGLVGGTSVLAPYLLIASFKANDNVKEILLGKSRANA
jgi:hypothetical protein